MAKSNEWCLNRLEVCGEFFLNEGDTTIGRNKKADVITPSQICSRNHCVITLDSDNKIHIKNQVNRIIRIVTTGINQFNFSPLKSHLTERLSTV